MALAVERGEIEMLKTLACCLVLGLHDVNKLFHYDHLDTVYDINDLQYNLFNIRSSYQPEVGLLW